MNPRHRHALIVAVSEFDDGDLEGLPGAATDGHRVHDFLADSSRGAFDGSVSLLISPSLREIQIAMGDLFAQAAADEGMALLYFATHGFSEGPEGLLLAPRDAIFDRRTTTMLPITSIASAISEHRVPRTVVVLDVCEAGGHATGASKIATDKLWADSLSAQANPEGHFLLAACGTRESSNESDGGGLFTNLLISLPDQVGEANAAEEWIQTEALAQAIVRAIAERSIEQSPEWSGLSVAIDVPFCRNPSYESDYQSPHAIVGAASFSLEHRTALAPSIGEFWNAFRCIGTGKWHSRVVEVIQAVANLHLPPEAEQLFLIQGLDTAARRVDSHGVATDRSALHGFFEAVLVQFGTQGTEETAEMHYVHTLLGETLQATRSDFQTFVSRQGWIAMDDGPASIVTAPIRFWAEAGRATLVAIAAYDQFPDEANELLADVANCIFSNERLQRVVWAGQYPDVTLVLAALVRADRGVAQACARRLFAGLLGLYSRGQCPAPAELISVDLGRILSDQITGVRSSLPKYADEGFGALLLALGASGVSGVELSSIGAQLVESSHVDDLHLYLPETMGAQFELSMSNCRTLSIPCTESGIAKILELDESTRRIPFDPEPRAIDILMTAASARVHRNRAAAGLLFAVPSYLSAACHE